MKYRHVAITGASSGIGAALARAFGRAGVAVTMVARRRDKMEALGAEMTAKHHVVGCDLADLDNAVDWVPEAEEALGPIDVLVNNAGAAYVSPSADADIHAGERVLAINLHAPLRLIRAVLPGMLERGRGALVNVASVGVFLPPPGMSYYTASKGGLASASEGLHGELLDTPIQVLTVYPGFIATELALAGMAFFESNRMTKLMPRGDVDELAVKVMDALDAGHHRLVYPDPYRVAWRLPDVARYLMNRFAPKLKK